MLTSFLFQLVNSVLRVSSSSDQKVELDAETLAEVAFNRRITYTNYEIKQYFVPKTLKVL